MSTIDSSRYFEDNSRAIQNHNKGNEYSQFTSGYLSSTRSTFRKSHHQISQSQTILPNRSNDDDQRRDWMQSIQRRFQLQLEKQRQLSSIIADKLKQQIQYIKLENESLKSKLSSQKVQICELTAQLQQSISSKQQYPSIVLPQTTNNLKSMLQTLQQQHEHCIQLKKDLLNTIQTHEIKIKLLQSDNKTLQVDNKLLQKQLTQAQNQARSSSQLESQNINYKKQIESLRKQINQLKCINNQNKLQFNNQLQELYREIQLLQQQHEEVEESGLDLLRDAEKQFQQQVVQQQRNLRGMSIMLQKQNARLNQTQLYKKMDLNEKHVIQQLYRKSLLQMKRNETPMVMEMRNLNIHNVRNENAYARLHQRRRFQYA